MKSVLFAAADLQLAEGQEATATRTHQTALALAILLICPLRKRNLAALDLERHLRRDARGRPCRFVISADECKSGTDLDVPLDDRLARRLERHLRVFRPLRGKEASPWLFAAPAPASHALAQA